MCAELVTPDCNTLVTLSSRCATVCPIVWICPALCACDAAIVCKSRRSSPNWFSSPSPFFWLRRFCSTSQTTSAASKIAIPINPAFIIPFDRRFLNGRFFFLIDLVHLQPTTRLLYPHLPFSENSTVRSKKERPRRKRS